jgi:hypothetical protein
MSVALIRDQPYYGVYFLVDGSASVSVRRTKAKESDFTVMDLCRMRWSGLRKPLHLLVSVFRDAGIMALSDPS